MQDARRTEQDHEPGTRLGGHGEPAQLRVVRCGQPGQQRVAGARPQHLLRGPQRILPLLHAYQRQAFDAHAALQQSGCIGPMRRRHPGDAPALPGQRRERRHHALQFPGAFGRVQDFGQRADRPAAARQFAIEHLEFRRHGRHASRAGSAAAPDDLAAKKVLKGCHGYCIFIQSPRPAQGVTQPSA